MEWHWIYYLLQKLNLEVKRFLYYPFVVDLVLDLLWSDFLKFCTYFKDSLYSSFIGYLTSTLISSNTLTSLLVIILVTLSVSFKYFFINICCFDWLLILRLSSIKVFAGETALKIDLLILSLGLRKLSILKLKFNQYEFYHLYCS